MNKPIAFLLFLVLVLAADIVLSAGEWENESTQTFTNTHFLDTRKSSSLRLF